MRPRPANPEDAEAITRIYNQGIEERIATFETRPRSIEEVRTRLEEPHPTIVVEDEGGIVSFAWTSSYSDRGCYSGVADFSVYVDRGSRNRGAGRAAMEALIGAAEEAGFWKLTSKVFVENIPSRKLLASLGFREVGVHEKHARLDGKWRDVMVVERLIPPNL
ncbi:MAG: arsinothricin resistance N-acetyltransferase ArsN1 family A [Rubrobacteraceae bacterium]